MSANIWEPNGLDDTASELVQVLGTIVDLVGYVRNPANALLSEVLKQTHDRGVQVYDFNEGMPQIACPDFVAGEQRKYQTPVSSVATQNRQTREIARHVADFDHTGTDVLRINQGPDTTAMSEVIFDENKDFFRSAAKDVGKVSRQEQGRLVRRGSNVPLKARTISARDLVQVDTLGGCGYAVVKVVPGLREYFVSFGNLVLYIQNKKGIVVQLSTLQLCTFEFISELTNYIIANVKVFSQILFCGPRVIAVPSRCCSKRVSAGAVRIPSKNPLSTLTAKLCLFFRTTEALGIT